VRIDVTTTLTSTSLQINEGWYRVKDGVKVTELDGPILLSKTEPILDNPYVMHLLAITTIFYWNELLDFAENII